MLFLTISWIYALTNTPFNQHLIVFLLNVQKYKTLKLKHHSHHLRALYFHLTLLMQEMYFHLTLLIKELLKTVQSRDGNGFILEKTLSILAMKIFIH